LMQMGADEISLGDTTGMGTAPRTKELLKAMRSAGIRSEDIAMHFHDTYGQALVNTAVSLEVSLLGNKLMLLLCCRTMPRAPRVFNSTVTNFSFVVWYHHL